MRAVHAFKNELLTIKWAEANDVILKVVNNQVVSKDNICDAGMDQDMVTKRKEN